VDTLPILFADVPAVDFMGGVESFFRVVQTHWRFCVLHFLEFAIWGAWYVVLGNFLGARGFSRVEIGRIYGTIPLGSIISPFFIGVLADKYVNTEVLIGVLHLVGGVLLFAMAYAKNPRPFYWTCLAYALCFAPTLSLVNSIIFAHNDDLFGGNAGNEFFWIRVFGTLGWICAGLSHRLILTPGQPMNARPIQLAAVLSFILGVFAFTLPATPPSPSANWMDALSMFRELPVFMSVSLIVAIAMAIYFAFAALFLEKSGVKAHNVGPVMTLGQAVEIFFMLALPVILGPNNARIYLVLSIGVAAWALRFGLFAIGRPMALLLLGVALHGICFDFFFATGFTYVAGKAPEGLAASAQSLYGILVYGLGMYIGTEGSGWLNTFCSREVRVTTGRAEISGIQADRPVLRVDPATGTTEAIELQTNWTVFWTIPCAMVVFSLIAFVLSRGQ
jgi:nucleoside transporter